MAEDQRFSFSDSTEKTPRKKAGFFKSCVALFFVVFFFPIGLFLMWRWNVWGRTDPLIVTVLCALFFLPSFLLGTIASLQDPTTTPISKNQQTESYVPITREELNKKKKINNAAQKISMQMRLENINKKMGKTVLTLSHIQDEKPGFFDKGSRIAVIIISDVWYESTVDKKKKNLRSLGTIWKNVITAVDPNDERDPVIWLLDVRNKNIGSYMLGRVNIA